MKKQKHLMKSRIYKILHRRKNKRIKQSALLQLISPVTIWRYETEGILVHVAFEGLKKEYEINLDGVKDPTLKTSPFPPVHGKKDYCLVYKDYRHYSNSVRALKRINKRYSYEGKIIRWVKSKEQYMFFTQELKDIYGL